MKVSIDTSNFSFFFLGVYLIVISVILFLFSFKVVGLVILCLSILIIIQKYKYVIPKKTPQVLGQIEKTFKLLSIEHKKTPQGFSTKVVHIKVYNFLFLTILQFNFDKMYNKQGKYLAEVVVKYQRYV